MHEFLLLVASLVSRCTSFQLFSPVIHLASTKTTLYTSTISGTVHSCPLSPPYSFTALPFKHSKSPTALLLTSTHLISTGNDSAMHVYDLESRETYTHKVR